MKQLIFLIFIYLRTNIIYCQNDSLSLGILSKLQSIPECKFSFQKNCIYGEIHDYKLTDKISGDLFDNFYKNSKGKIIYFIEGSSSVEYILYLYKNKYKHFSYGNRKISLNNMGQLTSLMMIYEKYKDDGNVSFKSIDVEGSFMLSLLCLKDIISKSGDGEYFQSENILMSKLINRSNSKLMSKAKGIVSEFKKDSMKYAKNLSDKSYQFYSSIIHDLKNGIIHEEAWEHLERREEMMEFRESYLFTKLVSKLDSDASFFLQCGLMHSMDSVGSLLWSRKWISLAERLQKKYGKTNFTKIGLANLKYQNSYINTRILNKKILKDLLSEKISVPSIIELKDFPMIKTDFDYVILYK